METTSSSDANTHIGAFMALIVVAGKGNAITPNAVHSSGDAENSSTQQEHEANDAAAIEQEGELPGDDDGNNNAHLSNGNDS